MSAYRIASDLEVIKRTGEHADPKAVSQLLAQGLIYEIKGKLVLSRRGANWLRATR